MERSSLCESKKSRVGVAHILPTTFSGSCVLLWSRGRVLANCLASVPASHPVNALTLQLICLSGLQECGNNEKHAIFWSALGSSPRGVCLHCALNPSGFAASQSLSSLCTKPGLSCLCLSPWRNSVFLVARPVWGEKGSGRFLVSGKPDGCPSSKLWVYAQLGGHKTLQSPGREGQDSTSDP